MERKPILGFLHMVLAVSAAAGILYGLKGTAMKPGPDLRWDSSQPRQNDGPNPTRFADSNSLFAFDLYAHYKDATGNLLFSPYSISSALTMTYEGARGQTAVEMKKVLHLPDREEDLRASFHLLDADLNGPGRDYKLITANALWAEKSFRFLADYLHLITEYYVGAAANLDFIGNPDASRQTINRWVEDKTSGKIENLLSPGVINAATRLVLTNAIYFKGDWSNPYNAQDTRDEDFHLDSGSTEKAKMMHQTSHFNYGETGDFQVLEMPYRGGRLSMIVILPKNLLAGISLDAAGWSRMRETMEPRKVAVTFPKFRVEKKYMMAGDLAKMGMPSAFNPRAADFSGMDGRRDLMISAVVHQTFVDVTEAGTEAAAATAAVIGVKAVLSEPKEEIKEFKADHPFIFLIQERTSGAILFLGRMSDPGQLR